MSKIINAPPRIMRAASAGAAGAAGYVPIPAAGDQARFLRGDGTFSITSVDGSDFLTYLEYFYLEGLVDF